MYEIWPVRPLRALAVACSLVLLCIAFVPTRGEAGGTALYGDAQLYADLVRGGVDIEAPFRYRVVVPLLARALPFAPGTALALISWLSLAGSYALLLAMARRLRIAPLAAGLGLALAIATSAHLYNYWNPFITDAAGLLMTTLSLYALLDRRFALFAAISALGIGVREACVFVAPAWVATRQWWRALGSVTLTLAVYVGLRVLVGPSEKTLDEGPFAIFPARTLGAWSWEVLSAWHALWLLAPMGLLAMREARIPLAVFALLSLAGALFTSLLATDTTRMFHPLFPLVALGMARFVELALEVSPRATALLCGVCLAASCAWQSVRFLPPLRAEDPLFRPMQASALGVLWLVGGGVGLMVWRRHASTLSEICTPRRPGA